MIYPRMECFDLFDLLLWWDACKGGDTWMMKFRSDMFSSFCWWRSKLIIQPPQPNICPTVPSFPRYVLNRMSLYSIEHSRMRKLLHNRSTDKNRDSDFTSGEKPKRINLVPKCTAWSRSFFYNSWAHCQHLGRPGTQRATVFMRHSIYRCLTGRLR